MSISDSATINEISHFVYETILNIQQQQPELLVERYRTVQWSNARNQSVFLDKLNEELNKDRDWEARILKVRRFLQAFLVPDSLETALVGNLLQTIRSYLQRQTETQENRLSDSEPAELAESTSPPAQPSSIAPRGEVQWTSSTRQEQGIAILLLDAENLQLNAETEKFLAGICTYPIQIKIAFANWRNMGKQDAEFHGRGYELIHVPPGKDSADVKMATVGSSIFVHYPTAKEVLVCSSDGVMTHLCTTLQTHGLTVYLVRKQGDNLTAFNSKTGKTQTYSSTAPPEIPSIEQFIVQLKDLIRAEQIRAGSPWIKLARISSLFQTKYKITISQVVSVHFPGKKAREIFSDFPGDFVVHQRSDQSELYITLFEMHYPNTALKMYSVTSTEIRTVAQPSLKVESKADLERALFRIVEGLTPKPPGSYVPITNVATEFQKQYGTPITNVMKRLQFAIKFPQFLQSLGVFKLKKVEKVYYVAISSADPPSSQQPCANHSESESNPVTLPAKPNEA